MESIRLPSICWEYAGVSADRGPPQGGVPGPPHESQRSLSHEGLDGVCSGDILVVGGPTFETVPCGRRFPSRGRLLFPPAPHSRAGPGKRSRCVRIRVSVRRGSRIRAERNVTRRRSVGPCRSSTGSPSGSWWSRPSRGRREVASHSGMAGRGVLRRRYCTSGEDRVFEGTV